MRPQGNNCIKVLPKQKNQTNAEHEKNVSVTARKEWGARSLLPMNAHSVSYSEGERLQTQGTAVRGRSGSGLSSYKHPVVRKLLMLALRQC